VSPDTGQPCGKPLNKAKKRRLSRSRDFCPRRIFKTTGIAHFAVLVETVLDLAARSCLDVDARSVTR
jgi:hypothetical protein